MTSQPLDITRLRQSGEALHYPVQTIADQLEGMTRTQFEQLPQRGDVLSSVAPAIADARRLLEVGAQIGLPGIPETLKTKPGRRS